MIDLNKTVDASEISVFHTVKRNGFAFRSLTYPNNVFDAIDIRELPENNAYLEKAGLSSLSLEEHIDFINRYSIEKAYIMTSNISFITRCPTLKYLTIQPSDNSCDNFDFSPIYRTEPIKYLSCATKYGKQKEFSSVIDCSKINGLEYLRINGIGIKNFNDIPTLKNLIFFYFPLSELEEAFSSTILDTLSITQGAIKNLRGIEKSTKMQCVYLKYNRSLQDISMLYALKDTLKALRINNCPKIKDFSVLSELGNLELLELTGSNELPNLDFLKSMKNLKTFIFNMNIQNGDLTPCLSLQYVYSEKNRKHYNLKDAELPKGQYIHGNEDIESWRRLE